jgi:hypothetical protein
MAKRRSHDVYLWGLVREHRASETVTIDYRNRGSGTWRRLKSDRTDSLGYWSTTTSDRGRSYRVRWTAPDGQIRTGPTTRAYAQR